MIERPMDEWEARLGRVARNLSYPPTPDLVDRVGRRLAAKGSRPAPRLWRLAWAVLVVLFLLVALLAVPQVRAAVLRVLRLGAVEIVVEPTPTQPFVPVTSTPALPSSTPLASILDLAGETTLAQAEVQAGFPVRLPTYPPDLGLPDRVFFQDLEGAVVVLVWLDPDQPDRVRLSLHQIGPGTFAQKIQPPVIQEVRVHGETALWTEGPYLLQFRRGDELTYGAQRLVAGHVLLWTEGELTYRLETDLSLQAAVQIAESLH